MIWFILVFFSLAFGICMCWLAWKKGDLENTPAVPISLILVIPLLLMWVSVASLNHPAQIERYETLKWNLSKIDKIDPRDIPLINEAISFNKTIAEHKEKHSSPFVGVWHSKAIGDLEPLKIPGGP